MPNGTANGDESMPVSADMAGRVLVRRKAACQRAGSRHRGGGS